MAISVDLIKKSEKPVNVPLGKDEMDSNWSEIERAVDDLSSGIDEVNSNLVSAIGDVEGDISNLRNDMTELINQSVEPLTAATQAKLGGIRLRSSEPTSNQYPVQLDSEHRAYVDMSNIANTISNIESSGYSTFTAYAYTDSKDTTPALLNAEVSTADDATWAHGIINSTDNIVWYKYQTFVEGKYLWIQTRYYNSDGEFVGNWNGPLLLTGADGATGADGNMTEFVYKLNDISSVDDMSDPDKQIINFAAAGSLIHNGKAVDKYGDPIVSGDDETTDGVIPLGWADHASSVLPNHKYLWCMQRNRVDGEWSGFTAPFLMSHYGVNGTDGDGVEYIYLRCTSEEKDTVFTEDVNRNPATWAANQDDDYINPTYKASSSADAKKWMDNIPTLSVGDICFVSIRKQQNGQWGTFSQPKVWSYYARNGQDGRDGTDAAAKIIRMNYGHTSTATYFEIDSQTNITSWNQFVESEDPKMYNTRATVTTQDGYTLTQGRWFTGSIQSDKNGKISGEQNFDSSNALYYQDAVQLTISFSTEEQGVTIPDPIIVYAISDDNSSGYNTVELDSRYVGGYDTDELYPIEAITFDLHGNLVEIIYNPGWKALDSKEYEYIKNLIAESITAREINIFNNNTLVAGMSSTPKDDGSNRADSNYDSVTGLGTVIYAGPQNNDYAKSNFAVAYNGHVRAGSIDLVLNGQNSVGDPNNEKSGSINIKDAFGNNAGAFIAGDSGLEIWSYCNPTGDSSTKSWHQVATAHDSDTSDTLKLYVFNGYTSGGVYDLDDAPHRLTSGIDLYEPGSTYLNISQSNYTSELDAANGAGLIDSGFTAYYDSVSNKYYTDTQYSTLVRSSDIYDQMFNHPTHTNFPVFVKQGPFYTWATVQCADCENINQLGQPNLDTGWTWSQNDSLYYVTENANKVLPQAIWAYVPVVFTDGKPTTYPEYSILVTGNTTAIGTFMFMSTNETTSHDLGYARVPYLTGKYFILPNDFLSNGSTNKNPATQATSPIWRVQTTTDSSGIRTPLFKTADFANADATSATANDANNSKLYIKGERYSDATNGINVHVDGSSSTTEVKCVKQVKQTRVYPLYFASNTGVYVYENGNWRPLGSTSNLFSDINTSYSPVINGGNISPMLNQSTSSSITAPMYMMVGQSYINIGNTPIVLNTHLQQAANA